MASLKWEDRDDARWILIEGELDHDGSQELGQSLADAAAASGGPVVVDLAAVSFVGSHALRLLLEANHNLGAAGRTMRVAGLRPIVRKVFETTGIFEAIPEVEN